MKRTKIVATLGPATDRPGVLERLLQAGVDVVRLNFSHGGAADRERRVRAVRETAAAMGRDVAILGDLQGPKIRVEQFACGQVELVDGASFVLDAALPADAGDQGAVGVTYRDLPRDVRAGDILLLNDGAITLEVQDVAGSRVECVVRVGGVLSGGKGINRQGGGLSAGALTDKDRADIELAARLELDYLAVSFPRSAADMEEARSLLRAAGGEALLVAKIERAEAVTHIEEIARASEVVMVARGDLGVEIGFAEVPGVQKQIIRTARALNRVVITATQMMESMIHEPIPTRAEVSDVANAVLDGSDAVMLSGETAVGRYPVKAVEAMASACRSAERQRATSTSHHRMDEVFARTDEAIAMATMYTANHMDVRAIVALTESGNTALWMSRIRSGIPIYAFSRNESTRRRVALYRGVYPVPFDVLAEQGEGEFDAISRVLLERGLVRSGDRVLLTEGHAAGIAGGTNSMRILSVG
ncbi:pyruvate kinase [Thioalkalivibrio sp. XN279]|uniref:pyruvate kinase n=1 Tax=Thioalkalivibrio sp. XN279 TaxID=2714953 RepID=UPI0014088A26|nr:pyruvate kinase [Thioalkalivibrio sp. XN279]NHA16108.1 pyruvate kinase [Thioalkalivibrio sp. XN279]